MHIHVLQHVPFEGPAACAAWAQARGYCLDPVELFAGKALPDPADVEALLVMGGPMGVHDQERYPWLAAEQALIGDCIAAGRHVIGICLGAQLIAAALGAQVRRNACPEIGWAPIELTDAGQASPLFRGAPPGFDVLHWHGETFELPAGAVQLARSEACEQQIFLYRDHVLGLQCHLEATPESVDQLVTHCRDELVPGPYVQEAARILAPDDERDALRRERLWVLLDAFFAP